MCGMVFCSSHRSFDVAVSMKSTREGFSSTVSQRVSQPAGAVSRRQRSGHERSLACEDDASRASLSDSCMAMYMMVMRFISSSCASWGPACSRTSPDLPPQASLAAVGAGTRGGGGLYQCSSKQLRSASQMTGRPSSEASSSTPSLMAWSCDALAMELPWRGAGLGMAVSAQRPRTR